MIKNYSNEDLEIANFELQKAFSKNDLETVVSIYKSKAEFDLKAGDEKSAYFLMTQAYIYALEGGFSVATDLKKILVLAGREVI
mgnify:CR=1 FL=1